MDPMLWTLWRAILIEFWRLMLLSTAVLVTVVAFAATVKPLADGKLTADQAVRFMFYAVPPMLAYTLPFAGGFAATLAYHRFASENEITAAHAGGVSHRRILVPALASGVLLAAGLFVLNDRVIPRFLVQMERMITRDFARIMVNSLQQGESARIGNTEIHADFVEQRPPEQGSPVRQQFLLAGVAMVETDNDGFVTIDGTSKRAWILMMPVWALDTADRERIGEDAETAVILKFVDVTVHRNGVPQSADLLVPPAIPIPSMFRDDPKFRSNAELREVSANPDLMDVVDRRRVALARMMAADRSFGDFAEDLRAGRPIVMTAPDGSQVRVLGSALGSQGARWVIEPLRESGAVEVEVVGPSGTDRLTAASARLTLQTAVQDDPLAGRAAGDATRFVLDLEGVRVLGAGADGSTEIAGTTYRDLWPARDPVPALLALNSEELIARVREDAAAGEPPGPMVADAADRLEREVGSMRREILSKMQQRLAMSGSCVVMVFLGAVMAMRLKDATPLVVYLWSFFPALFAVLITETGQEATHDHGLYGLPLLWAGVLGLGAFALLVYRRMARL
jgi:lipopolysaccharide export LptBFGC system permease protein LptF